jgi:hypothetical protein
MKRKLISPPIYENGDHLPLANIEGLVELEPESGCFASSRMRDEYRIMKSRFIHPPDYVDKQVRPYIKSNDREKEVVWTYLVARKYVKDLKDLVRLLCGQENLLMPEESKIWLEAYLQPTRQGEGVSWKTRADLAIGHFEEETERENQIQGSGGEWVCIVESKWYDDIRLNAKSDDRLNQFLRIIEHALLLHDKKGHFPEKVYVTLVTPKYFKEGTGKFSDRKYPKKYKEYKDNPEKLKKDLAICALPFLKYDVETLISRTSALILNWVTFEELLGLPNLVEDQIPGKYRVTIDTWKKIFSEMGRPDLSSDLS